VFLYLFALDRFLAEAIRRSIAQELEVPYLGMQGARRPKVFAESFLDCPIEATEESEEIGSLKRDIETLLVKPVYDHKERVARGQRLPKHVPVSAILFGPPGTSKTEIVEQIASFIGWPAMTV